MQLAATSDTVKYHGHKSCKSATKTHQLDLYLYNISWPSYTQSSIHGNNSILLLFEYYLTCIQMDFKFSIECFHAVFWVAGMHLAHKTWVVRYWWGYLSEARCKWFAYSPADATATTSSLASVKSRRFTFLMPAYPGCPGKKAIKRM